ncbi:MAG: BON domain-containing protein [Deltaproteobacteria bacterium]|nr:MAG: BON domain-containing protein [Deltaproteobacteria bacterium]
MKPSKYKKIVKGVGTLFLVGGLVIPAAYGYNSSKYPADNSGKNVRDRQDLTLTPEDQSGSHEDLKITQQIRKSLHEEKTLSINAKNIKIMTVNGKTTFRGPVSSEKEKTRVCEMAKHVVGSENVIDQLEVITQ